MADDQSGRDFLTGYLTGKGYNSASLMGADMRIPPADPVVYTRPSEPRSPTLAEVMTAKDWEEWERAHPPPTTALEALFRFQLPGYLSEMARSWFGGDLVWWIVTVFALIGAFAGALQMGGADLSSMAIMAGVGSGLGGLAGLCAVYGIILLVWTIGLVAEGVLVVGVAALAIAILTVCAHIAFVLLGWAVTAGLI